MARRAGDASTLAPALANLGRLGLARGDLAMAREAFEEALVVSRACGHVDQVVFGLALLGDAARLSGEPDAARARYREALRASHVLCPGEPAVQALTRLAGLEAVAGSTERAARLFAASGAWRARAGRPVADHRDPWRYASTHGSDLAAVRAHLGEPAVAAAWAEGEAMPLEEAIADALEDSNEEQAIAPAGPSRAAEPQQE